MRVKLFFVMQNTITEKQGEEIAQEFGFTLSAMRANFEQANESGRAGKHDAESLFRSYCSQMENESMGETQEALRNEERAHGSRYGDRDFDY